MTHALTWKWTLRLLPHTTRQTTFLVTLVAELHLAAGDECSNGLRVARIWSFWTSDISQRICRFGFCLLKTRLNLFHRLFRPTYTNLVWKCMHSSWRRSQQCGDVCYIIRGWIVLHPLCAVGKAREVASQHHVSLSAMQ